MSKGSRAKHARIEYTPVDDQDDEAYGPMCEDLCDGCGAYPKTSRSNLCESCEAMSAPRAGQMK